MDRHELFSGKEFSAAKNYFANNYLGQRIIGKNSGKNYFEKSLDFLEM